ncbi:MAG: hypothetical protein JNJ83_04545 [Verrucomicrobiaceae bacterium]|nr:hypothetical protein [Verrucomicrobiaceae bacterium]
MNKVEDLRSPTGYSWYAKVANITYINPPRDGFPLPLQIVRDTTTGAAGALIAPAFVADLNNPGGRSDQIHLPPVDIEPDANMAGVIGDVVKSLKPGSTVEHFVTPKKSTELNQEYVVLKAVGVTAEQITDGNANQIVEWDKTVGEAFPGDPLKWRVKRDATNKHEVKIKAKQGGTVAAQMNVWVIWSDIKQEQGDTEFLSVPNPNGGEVWRVKPEAGKQKRFVFMIEPKSITDLNAEIPDLAGVASSQHLPPGSNKHRWDDSQFDPESTSQPPTLDSGDNAKYRWDVSRQMQISITNADSIPKAELKKVWFPSVCIGQPAAGLTRPVSFPALDYEGNDDPGYASGTDEDDDPYHASSTGDLRHAVGEITSTDRPSVPALDAWVTKSGMKLQFEFKFREFARVQLWDGKRGQGQFWFRISKFSDGEWHHHAKFESGINFWKNDGSTP